jgi:hypothetical protein
VGIASTPQFPGAQFGEVNGRVAKAAADTKKDQWHSFAAAWNAVDFRTRAAEAYSAEFTEALKGIGRYRQDHAIFGFAVSSASAIECFYYAAYSVGNLVNASQFAMAVAKDLKFYPSTVAQKYLAAFPGDVLSNTMDAVLKSTEFMRLSDLRNVLSHRGTPPRMHYASVGAMTSNRADAIPENLKDLPSNWIYAREVTESLIADLNDWRRIATRDLVSALHGFTGTHIL